MGKSGIGIMEARTQFGYRSSLSGILPKPDIKNQLERRLRIGLSQESEFAYCSAVEAFKNAGIDSDFIKNNEIGIIYGNDSSAQALIESYKIAEEKHDTSMVGSGAVFKSMNSTVSMNLSTIFNLRGINFSISAACASGSHSIGTAFDLIRNRRQNIILCGGAQEVDLYSVINFDALGIFSKSENNPQKASRPFDKNRDGLVPSGGAASLILESAESAKKRGAKIYAEIVGYGFSSSGSKKITELSAQSGAAAIIRALSDAELKTNDIDYINAHATSTPEGDKSEAMSILNVFENKQPLISSTKSMTGHECWMAGASEIIYSLIMMNNDFAAPNINFDDPDETTKRLNIVKETKNTNIDCVLSDSFGFGGTNACLIIKKFKE